MQLKLRKLDFANSDAVPQVKKPLFVVGNGNMGMALLEDLMLI
jgi:hypothetical protein